MYLKSLEISGFKSFARKANLQFSSAITGIVGPNGSGKSNVAEAFRFVLGEQSIKSLRGRRGEDMIWNGGGEAAAALPKANRAGVKLVFDNTRKIFPTIDFDEVSIERVVHRDNANEYLLNGSQVRLKDIVELLAAAHIGATGHHIISQGEADRILSASLRERREMIEDALGLKMYQWKKLESLRKLERTEENMKQVESLRREIAPHIKFLKKQVEKVERAEQLRRELIVLYKEYFAVEEIYIEIESRRIKTDLAGPVKELSDLDRRLEGAKKVMTESKNKDHKSDEIIAIEGKLREVRAARDQDTRELGRIEGEINADLRAIAKEQSRLKNEASRTVYLKDVEDLVRTIESFKIIEDVRKLFSDVVITLRTFISSHRGESDSALIADAEREIARLTKEQSGIENRLKQAAELENRLDREYADLKNMIEKEKDTNREAEKEIFEIIARQNEVRGVVGSLRTKLTAVDHLAEEMKRELGEAAVIVGREAVDYGKERQELQNSLSIGDRASQEDRKKKIERHKIRLEDSGGSGGAEVLKEYRDTEERDAFLARELVDLDRAKSELMKLITDLDARIDYEFKNGILKINSEFHKYFTLMFGGGKAELVVVKEIKNKKKSALEDLRDVMSPESEAVELTNPEGETEQGPEGIEVNISLPRKKVKGLMMLSGGERALTSIALLFAISQVNPPPFIVLDETDAALDEANSRKYGEMIENLSKQSQLILITHNRETMSHASVLYGVTMGADGASRLLSIAFEEAVAVAK